MSDIRSHLSAKQWKTLFSHEKPFFLYDFGKIRSNLSFIRSYLKGLIDQKCSIYFSTKSNPNNFLLKCLIPIIDGFDTSSEIEMRMMRNLGVEAPRLSLSGPGKPNEAYDFAIGQGVGCIHLDSISEYEAFRSLQGKRPDQGGVGVTLRLQLDSDETKLGLSLEEVRSVLKMAARRQFYGLHTYLGRESFSGEALSIHIDLLSRLISEFRDAFVKDVKLYIGPGLPSLKALKKDIRDFSNPIRSPHPVTFELGRSLVSDIGFYAAQVLSVKPGRVPTVILNGGVHHLGSPLLSVYSAGEAARVQGITAQGTKIEGEMAEFAVYGSLCLSHDCLHPKATLPRGIKRAIGF
ncbi:MAG: hypothetical protein IPJ71_01900 [Bdellovibrionales bacterium]|nr:hypothetical protein [Bdellovibrionales bacterium]